MLAQRGLRIAVVDFDLEAPGLHVAFGTDPPPQDTGLVPLLIATLATPIDEQVPVVDHLQVVTPREGAGKLLLLPVARKARPVTSLCRCHLIRRALSRTPLIMIWTLRNLPSQQTRLRKWSRTPE